MKNDRLRIAIVASTVFGLIAAYGVYDFLRTQRRAVEALRDSTQDVVVAAKEIPPGAALDVQMLRIAKYPKASAVGFATIPPTDEGGLSIAAVNRMIAGAVRGVRARAR